LENIGTAFAKAEEVVKYSSGGEEIKRTKWNIKGVEIDKLRKSLDSSRDHVKKIAKLLSSSIKDEQTLAALKEVLPERRSHTQTRPERLVFSAAPSRDHHPHPAPSDTSDRVPGDIRGISIPRDDNTNAPDPYFERMRALFTARELECLYESTKLTTPRHYSLAAGFGDQKKFPLVSVKVTKYELHDTIPTTDQFFDLNAIAYVRRSSSGLEFQLLDAKKSGNPKSNITYGYKCESSDHATVFLGKEDFVIPSLRSPQFDFILTFKTQLAAQTFFARIDALIRVHRLAREINAVLEARMDKQIKLDSIESFRSSVASRKMI